MKLEMIIKLAKLANNNPNENEANLAARKACKLMGEADFKFPTSNQGGTWNDVKRSTEPQWSSQRPSSSGFDPFWDMFNREYTRKDPFWNTPPPGWKTRDYQGHRDTYNPYDIPKSPPYEEPKKKPKIKLKCKACQKEYETTFNKPGQDFVCGNCQWSNYHHEKTQESIFDMVIECCECGAWFNISQNEYSSNTELYKRCEHCRIKSPFL